jgi:hypothetical protein
MQIPYEQYVFIGTWAKHLLMKQEQLGLLCTKFKVLHLSGPAYAFLFDQFDFEINKYRSAGRDDIVAAYERRMKRLPSKEILETSLQQAFRVIGTYSVFKP